MADETPMAEQLNRIEGRVVSLEERLAGLEQRVSVVQTDMAVLQTDVSGLTGELREFRNAVKIQFEHVDQRFNQMAEQRVSLVEHMDRRFDVMERRQAADMAFIKQVLLDHSGRIRQIEDASGRSS